VRYKQEKKKLLNRPDRLGSLYKALSWYDLISQLDPVMRWMHADAALYYLRVFLGTEE
jgi:replication-associated recombination protein RarA